MLLRALWSCALMAALSGIAVGESGDSPRKISFDRQVRPVLSSTCFTCHGPDEHTRQADLRLDRKDDALADRGGYAAVVAGNPEESELVARITADDDSRMPPRDAPRQLTPEQIETLRQWIAEGADWQGHWAFVPPVRSVLPEVAQAAWAVNPVDRFIMARLSDEKLAPSPAADRMTLIRRVTLDLTGLPPTPAEVDAFVADSAPDAYERLVDRLLASPRYGEHMTRFWLDGARYGDTHGLHLDNERSIWPYRDWVIRAFNENKPFDQFTVEQLAGDLLPNPTTEQLVATGFNRSHVTTSEGGSIDEEFLVRYAVDSTDTTGTVWLGLTLGCAACHDHKFDPISQREFYSLYAFFNSTQDKPMDGNALLPPPTIPVPSTEQQRQQEALDREIAQLRSEIRTKLDKIDYRDTHAGANFEPVKRYEQVWIDDSLPSAAQPQGDGPEPWRFVTAPEHPVHSGQNAVLRKAEGRSQHFFTGANPGLTLGESDRLFAHVYLDPADPPQAIMLQFNDGSWEHRAYWGEDVIDWGQPGTASRLPMGPLPERGKWVRLEVEAARVGLGPGSVLNGWAFTQHGGTVYWDTAGLSSLLPPGGLFDSQLAWEQIQRMMEKPALPPAVHEAVKIESAKRTAEQERLVRDYFVEHVYSGSRDLFAPLHARVAEVTGRRGELEKAIPATMIMRELDAPRETFVLDRGQYDKPTVKVERGVPVVLPALSAELPANRLGLARWLVDPGHPLTARVTVNRFWQQLFGTGLVKTAEDFGSQGEPPSHPELLDWLAREFIETGWDVKRLMRLIVTSATYRQSSHATPGLISRDPENRLLARGPRFRLDAEMVRDHALYISGLMVEQIGGPSVKPYQPAGLWEAVAYPTSTTAKFVQDRGEKLYRRSMYTFWKRTSPPPNMLLLDAPSRETCTVRRARTNTPLAALALMNDVQFFEAARGLAQRMIRDGGSNLEDRIAYGFRLAVARPPDGEELRILADQYHWHLNDFHRDKVAAEQATRFGESPPDPAIDPAELAAMTLVANALINLDESLTKN